MGLKRRDILKAASMAGLLGLTSTASFANTLPDNPFRLGVASGDPWPDGFVLWTRLAPRPLDERGGMPTANVVVRYEIATDQGFRQIVRTGEEIARPELSHSVHAEIEGLLPARRYWYRFFAGDYVSQIGTVRTAPEAGAVVDKVRIGVAGCQRYEDGLYTAYQYLAAEPDLDAIFHYGDYIYEYAGLTASGGKPAVRMPAGTAEIYSLDDYRRRYAQVKLDPDLQAAHSAAAFLITIDDHEVDNNWAGEFDESDTPSAAFLVRRTNALQAWYEHQPVRKAQMPGWGKTQLYRRLDYGRLLRINLLDTRQFRDKQRCSVGQTSPCRTPDQVANEQFLGQAQEAWLRDGLSNDIGWNLLAQQVMVMPFHYPASRSAGRVNQESWSGYPEARQRLIDDITGKGLKNVVIATGDVHKHHVGNLPVDPARLDGPVLATEFVCTSISSGGDGEALPADWAMSPAENPHNKLIDGRRGYQVFTVEPRVWTTDVRVIDRVTTPGGKISALAQFEVDPRNPGV